MARKAQTRPRSTTRPRRSSARIAQDRARGRGERKARAPKAPSEKAKKKKAPKRPASRGTLLRRREGRTEVRRGRFLLLVAFMAALGFTSVYLGEAALSAVRQLDVDGQGSTLWDKLVDRMLDRDIPTSVRPARKAPAAPKDRAPVAKVPPAAPKPPPRPRPKVEAPPKVAVPATPRADLAAPSPDEYARATQQGAAVSREEAAQASRRRIEALLEKVGVER